MRSVRGYSAVLAALHRAVHGFGVDPLNTELGHRHPNTLSNKVNPGLESHHLRLDEFLFILQRTGDVTPLRELARAVHHVLIPVGDFAFVSDIELLTAYTRYHAEVGETAQALHAALANGQIESPEYDVIEREFFEDVAAGCELLARIRALVLDADPKRKFPASYCKSGAGVCA